MRTSIKNTIITGVVLASVASNVYLVNENKSQEALIDHETKRMISITKELDKNKSEVSTLNNVVIENQKVIDDLGLEVSNRKAEIVKLEQQQKEHPTKSVSRGSIKRSSGIKYEATAYAYTGSPTCTGVMPKAGRTIAVDPRIIPLGSKVYIEGLGTFIAQDTGGAIKGRIIDIYMNTEAECNAWGRRSVIVHIIS